MHNRAASLVACVAVFGLIVTPAAGLPAHETCGGPAPEVFASGIGQAENLVFDGDGHVYVSTIDGELHRFTPDGSMETLLEGDVPLGGLAIDTAGRLYVGVSVGLATPIPAPPGTPLLVTSGESEVWRFSDLFPPEGDPLEHEVYVTGIDSANGLALDADGNLYISEGFDMPILRVPPGGEPEEWATAVTPNGLKMTPDGDGLYAVQTFDPLSRIVRIELDNPTSQSTVASLSGLEAPLPKGLDDLGVGPDGAIYVTGHVSGEVLRVDPESGTACVLATAQEPSAALVAHGFEGYDGDVFATAFDGSVLVVRT